MEDINNADYVHTKRVFQDFEIKYFGEYHDLYIQSNALLLVDVFENFRNLHLEIYELGPAHFFSFKSNKEKLDLSPDVDILLMGEKGFRDRLCHAVNWYAEGNTKYVKNYDENKKSKYLKYWNINYLYEWTMPQKSPLGVFKWVENFIKSYNQDSNARYFIEADVQYPEKLYELHNGLPFFAWKNEN